jgi:hypothetical protein
MQSVGVIGESLILCSIPAGNAVLRGSIVRFILFDGAGVLCLVAALMINRPGSSE